MYTLGKDNGRADALSRRHNIAGTKLITDSALLKFNKDGSLGPARMLNQIMKIASDVPEELQEAIIQQHHNDPVHGHPSIARTIELIKQNYEFPNIKDKVTSFIAKCADC